MIEVILFRDVEKVGKIGDVVKVSDGFARNFLFPQKIAYLATGENLRKIEQEKTKRQAAHEKAREEAQAVAEKLNTVSCTISVEVNDLEKLYGSVSEADIAKALEAEGYKVDKKSITLDRPVTELGIYEAGVQLHPQVTAKVRVWVTKK